jgi:glycerophosphoryl diester phosphodiesterase
VTFAFLDGPTPLAFAHRGGAASAPENTMAAFERAVAAGYRYLETDVHATADGKVVVFHDRTLTRMTGRPGRIGELPWSVVRAARVAGSERIPLLEELIGAWPDTRLNIDVKADTAVEPLLEVVRRTGALDRVCIGAFSDWRLRRVRAGLGSAVCTSMGPREVLRLRRASWVGRAEGGVPGVQVVQVPIRFGLTFVDERFVGHAHRLGMQVHVWTIDDPAVMNRLLDLGVDGIMTDRLDTLREVYCQRGVWAA